MNVIIISANDDLVCTYRRIAEEYPNDNVTVVYLNPEKMEQHRIIYTLKSIKSPRIIVIDLILHDPYPCITDQIENYYDSHHALETKTIFESLRQDKNTGFIITFFSSCGNELWRRWVGYEGNNYDQATRFADYSGSPSTYYEKHKKAFESLLSNYQ